MADPLQFEIPVIKDANQFMYEHFNDPLRDPLSHSH